MYRSFYGLTKKPFQISSDPAFMWLGEKHKEALATLKYGILDNKGFLLLTGDVGTGKTTLINALIQSLGQDIICTAVPDPSLEKMDFFNYISTAFGIEKEFTTKGAFLAYFRQFLIQASETGKKVLLIIDEAQLLTQELLEEIRLLSNIEKTDAKLINIFFIGQNEFNEILNRQQNRAVRQRLTLNYNIDPLTLEETIEYINYRLEVAGAKKSIFATDAMVEIYMYSGGFPRRINVICDHCLLSGYVKEQQTISADIVKECARELKIPERIRNRDIDGFRQQPEPVASGLTQPQQTVSQIPIAMPLEKENKVSRFFLPIIITIVFMTFTWFFMFPEHFAQSVKSLKERFKQTITTVETTINSQDNVVQKFPERIPDAAIETKPNDLMQNSLDSHLSDSTTVSEQKQMIVSTDETAIEEDEKKNDSPNEPDLQLSPSKITIIEKIQPIQPPVVQTKTISNQDNSNIKSVDTEEPGLNNHQDQANQPLPLPKEKIIVRFKYNTNDFTQNGYEKLVDFANVLATHPETKILISGYTDREGTKAYNQKLSEFRANIIQSFFLGRGIKPAQIHVIGRGSENPIESNESAWGRMMNRRVEIEILQN